MRASGKHQAGLALALAFLCVGLMSAPSASAQSPPYTIDPRLSLTGNCDLSPPYDLIPDPDCAGDPLAYPPPPGGPSGRFDRPGSVAVDDWGNLYVANFANGSDGWIDVFDAEGHFITELDDPFGPRRAVVDGEGNLYVLEALSVHSKGLVRYPPTTYNPAAGEIAYDPDDRDVITTDVPVLIAGIAIDRREVADPADDRLYVPDSNHIKIFGSAAEGNTLVDTIEMPGIATYAAAVDAQRRRLYATHCKNILRECVVWLLEADAPYGFVKEIDGSTTPAGKFFSEQGRISLAVDEKNGHLFVGDLVDTTFIYEYDANQQYQTRFAMPAVVSGVQPAVAKNSQAPDPDDENPLDNYRHLFVPYGSQRPAANVIAFAPPSVGPPIVKGTQAAHVGSDEAELEARIDPQETETTYAIEYVSESQHALDGFESASLAATGTLPAIGTPQRVGAFVSDLAPGSAYRLRVVATNEHGTDEEEAAFSTHSDASTETAPCPNAALRAGASAPLPDCRAYELVTRPDAGGPIGASFEGERFGMVQASPDGDAVSFELNTGALPGTEASGYWHGDPYLATRSASGWSTEHVGPTGTMSSKPKPGSFSPGQGYSFFTAAGEGSAVIDPRTTYLRYPDGRSELIGRGSIDIDASAGGRLITEGGTHVIFETDNFDPAGAQKLEPNAPEEGTTAVYDRARDPLTGIEQTHVVSLLPGEITPAPEQHATFAGASPEGEGIAFRIGTTLYLRVGNEVTHEIGTGVEFAGLADGGERVFYLRGGDLEAFDAPSEEVTDFTGADIAAATPVNVAPQGTRAYFVSETATGAANPNGDTAQAGEQNLYLAEEDPAGEIQVSFIATVTELDVEGLFNAGVGARGHGLGLWIEALQKRQPAIVSSRLTPDGATFVFQSRANLDGYDSGEAAQIYRYSHLEGRLHCVSCPPTKTAASGGAYLQSLFTMESSAFGGPYSFVPALRADGERLFFESTEALVSGDTDGLRDVYEWEEEGVGGCRRAGGCVYLISPRASGDDEYLYGHSSDGEDVFFTTDEVLVAGDQTILSVYDARVGGGFATPVPSAECLGEACQPAVSPPVPPTPASSTFRGLGDFPAARKPCPKGKRRALRKGRAVCVRKKKSQRQGKRRKANARRRAAR
jgi:hypothetical protein